MNYRRAELHNHSTESDGSLTIRELVDYGEEKEFGILAVTDHNTCSGHQKADAWIRAKGYGLELVGGAEITTFFGHVLALGLTSMTDITELDPAFPELLLRKLQEQGAVTGIAHPFCVGEPVMTGCRFSMDVKNWSCVDYIEIFNTSSSHGFSGNREALEFWENLVLSGCRLAACAGKDLHRRPEKEEGFTTFILGFNPLVPAPEQVFSAIRSQRTIVTRGPLAEGDFTGDGELLIRFDHSNSYLDWNERYHNQDLVVTVRDNLGSEQSLRTGGRDEILVHLDPGVRAAVIRVYEESCVLSGLLAAGIPVYRRDDRQKEG